MNQVIRRYFQYKNRQFHKRNFTRIENRYFDDFSIYKLQIGCQGQVLQGWLNVDLIPKSREVAMMDATKPFPFKDNQFAFIFSEHMIEHITFQEAAFMLEECYRVMRKDGAIRISTPDLNFLIDLYSDKLSDIQEKYILHSGKYIEEGIPLNTTTVINNFFKDWGHQFIHDFESLGYLMTRAGFREIKRVEVGQSEYQELAGLEMHGNEIGDDFNRLESIVVEAKK